MQCTTHLTRLFQHGNLDQSMTIYVPVEQVSHPAWQKGSRDLKGYNQSSCWIIAYTKNGLRKERCPTYCCSPDIGWEKLGSDNIHECKVCCSKEFSCKKTQILNILRIPDPELFERGESHRQGQMPFDSLSLEDLRLLQNRKEPPSEGKPRTEGV